LPKFVGDDNYHLALAARDAQAGLGWTYHGPAVAEGGAPAAVRQSNGDWVINGTVSMVANAPLAQLFAVQVRTDPKKTGMNGVSTLLVPRGATGLTVRERGAPFATVEGQAMTRWHHGAGSGISFKDCRVPADSLLGKEGQCPFASGEETARC